MNVARVKVTRNYQISIPADIRRRLKIKLGDLLEVRYDEEREEIVIRKVKDVRKTLRAGRDLKPEEIEELIEKGFKENL